MTEVAKVKRLVYHLRKASLIADELELELGNGALCGSLISGIADELEVTTAVKSETHQRKTLEAR